MQGTLPLLLLLLLLRRAVAVDQQAFLVSNELSLFSGDLIELQFAQDMYFLATAGIDASRRAAVAVKSRSREAYREQFGGILGLDGETSFGDWDSSRQQLASMFTAETSESSSRAGGGAAASAFALGGAMSKGKPPPRTHFLVDILSIEERNGVRTADVQLYHVASEEVLAVVSAESGGEEEGEQSAFAASSHVLASKSPSLFRSISQRVRLHTHIESSSTSSDSAYNTVVWMTVRTDEQADVESAVFRQCCVADAGSNGMDNSLSFLRVGPLPVGYASDESNMILITKIKENPYVDDRFSEFKFDFKLAEFILEPVFAGSSRLVNNSTLVQEQTSGAGRVQSTSKEVDWSQNFIAGVEFVVETRLPMVVDGELALGFTSLTNFGAAYSQGTDDEVLVESYLAVPPFTVMESRLEFQLGKVEAPFVGRLTRRFSLKGMARKVSYRIPGVFKETNVFHISSVVTHQQQLPIPKFALEETSDTTT